MSAQEQEITLLSVNQGGIASLSNGSFWRIAPDHLKRIRDWRVGMIVAIVANDRNMIYTHSLIDPDGGVYVSIMPSSKLK